MGAVTIIHIHGDVYARCVDGNPFPILYDRSNSDQLADKYANHGADAGGAQPDTGERDGDADTTADAG